MENHFPWNDPHPHPESPTARSGDKAMSRSEKADQKHLAKRCQEAKQDSTRFANLGYLWILCYKATLIFSGDSMSSPFMATKVY